MNWTKTPPTEPGLYYWRWKEGCVPEYHVRNMGFIDRLDTILGDIHEGKSLEELGGEWGGRVPAPGTTFTEKEIFNWLSSIEQRYKKPCMFTAKLDLQDKDTGIAATTARHRKEQG